MKRRDFIANTIGGYLALQIPLQAFAGIRSVNKTVKIGLITDLHQDIIHNGKDRLQSFIAEMKQVKPDAIAQLGDFAYPGEKNKEVIDLFNTAHSSRLHVIGNHDTDAGFTKEQCIQVWGMPARYYVKELGGITFIVLDANDKGSPSYKGGYPSYINAEQINWLKEQLNQLKGPAIILSHQPLAGALAVDNAAEIQDILGAASQKILLAINGHTHIDSLVQVKNVNYLHINSASYFWVGSQFKHDSYTADIHRLHPWIASTCPYRDALFTVMTIDPGAGSITFTGRKTEWMGKSPEALGFTGGGDATPGKEIVPQIRERETNTQKLN